MTHNPYQAPQSYDIENDDIEYEYAGFWIRLVAYIVDSLVFGIIGAVVSFVLSLVGLYDWNAEQNTFDLVWSIIVIAVSIVMWVKYAGTPAKRLLKLKILNADTGEPLTAGRAILRYIGYIPAFLVLCIGVIWVAFDPKKQGWHDKIANSVVVKEL